MTDGLMDRQMDKQTDRRMDGQGDYYRALPTSSGVALKWVSLCEVVKRFLKGT